jgi:hypothetical protein
MKPIKYVKGDLFPVILRATEPVVLPHVCNDLGAFGAGFVVPLGRTFPLARQSYIDWHTGKNTADFALGETQLVQVRQDAPIVVANMIGQHGVGGKAIRYIQLGKCLEHVAGFSMATDSQIHAPMFGAGLAGGDWNIIQELINESWIMRGIDVTIYYLDGTLPSNWKLPSESN